MKKKEEEEEEVNLIAANAGFTSHFLLPWKKVKALSAASDETGSSKCQPKLGLELTKVSSTATSKEPGPTKNKMAVSPSA